MKKLAIALSALAISAAAASAPALASNRVNSLDMTSSQVKQLVQEQGSAILATGANQFDRYVANGSYCGIGEEAKAAHIPTADDSSAFIGYTCAVPDAD